MPRSTHAMVLYIGFAQRDEWSDWTATYRRHLERFAQASGEEAVLVPYDRFTPELVAETAPLALVLSGFARSFQDYPPGAFDRVATWLLKHEPVPTLAICGSHQLLGFVFSGVLQPGGMLSDQPMRRLRPGEPVVDPNYHPDHYMEKGFFEITLVEDDALFAECSRPPVFKESHYCEVKTLPPGFRLLASTRECRIQAMRHETRPLIGVQFHPEDYTQQYPDGSAFLRAFFREASEYASLSKRGVQ